MENKTLAVLDEREVLGKQFKVYGDWENPLFLARDVAEWIEHGKPAEMLFAIDDSEKLKAIVTHSGQNREMWFLTEDGMYEVLMQSRKPIAKAFKRKVKEILRDLRRNGMHITPVTLAQMLSNPDTMIEMITKYRDEKVKREEAELELAKQRMQIEEQKPLVEFAKDVTSSVNAVSIGDFAKMLCGENITIGQNRLFQWLREKRYLINDGTNKPYQEYIDRGYFKVIAQTYETSHGTMLTTKTLITGKGQVAISEKLRKSWE
jgi:phage antirepressor YoqD-like protein